MCGIAGYYLRTRAADIASVRAMCDKIRHRGPDDEGFHVEGGCAIGIRRLSIIDLATGRQPISNEDDSLWVVFNGEIYNYSELRTWLEQRGHHFKTHSDTETLVHLYEEEGEESLKRLRGMFTIALWDSRRGRLMLARDRFGKKPLYVAIQPEGIYFGSELKCLSVLGVPGEIDPEALRLYFQFSYIPDPRTAYCNVEKLEPGGWLTYDRDGTVRRGRYWKLPAPSEHAPAEMTEAETRDRLRETFDESVRLRMIADVPLGAFLSGGIDSGSVVASMSMQSKAPVKTFSIGFEEAAFNELDDARQVARMYKTEHHEIIVRPDSVDLILLLARHFDEPFGDSSAIPTYLVSEFAARHVKVALSGDGGDELFAGYESFWAIDRLRGLDRTPQLARRALAAVADLLPYSAYGKNYLRMISRPSALERYFELNYAPYYLRRQLLTPDWMLPGDAAFLQRTFAQCLLPNGADILTQALYFEATAKLTGDMLVKVDRMSMANSLEVRCPLLDQELALLAAKIPHSWKLGPGKGKRILIDALGERLPPELLTRPKRGFGVPLSLWFRGPLKSFLWDHLRSAEFRGRGITSAGFVDHLLEEHDRGRRDNSHWLWMLLMLELWFREANVQQGHAASSLCS
jgi:asparagine synthase (glutamine-hydrolysing)